MFAINYTLAWIQEFVYKASFMGLSSSLLGVFLIVGCENKNELEPFANQVDISVTIAPYPGLLRIEEFHLNEIAYYRNALDNEYLTPREKEQLEEALKFAVMQATSVAVERPTPDQAQIEADILATAAVMTPRPTPTLQTGIIDEGELFVVHPPRRVAIENIWQDMVDDKLIRVYAGLLLPDYRQPGANQTQHGAVYVMTVWPNGKTVTGLYITETETGALRIIGQTGSKLIFLDANNGSIYFDFLAYQFVDSVAITLPTATPPGSDINEPTPSASYP